MIDHEEVFGVREYMINYGGSFVKALGVALGQADHINQQKIKDAFPEYWEEYKNMWIKGEANKDLPEHEKDIA